MAVEVWRSCGENGGDQLLRIGVTPGAGGRRDSREEFGKLVNYAPSTIGAFETGDRFPSTSLATGADELLKTGGLFGRMLDKPKLVALVDETALRQPIGGPEVMARQLARLATGGPWIVQVVPLSAETYIRFEGAFSIATVDGRDVVYMPAQLTDYVVDSPELVAEARWRWDAIRSEALPRRQSRDLILKVARGYERSGGEDGTDRAAVAEVDPLRGDRQ